MTALVLARQGVLGHVHVAALRGGVLRSACKRSLSPTSKLWTTRAAIRTLWLADATRRCPKCSREVSPLR